MASIPKTTKQWTVEVSGGFDSLKLNNSAPIPEISDYEVLVKLHFASLNYRDLIIPKGQYPFAQRAGVVPGSDGAGEVIAIGSKVSRFQVGSKVCTTFNQGHLANSLDHHTSATGLGGTLDGTLRQYAIFNEDGLVAMPPSLTYKEASTLSCAAVTAWNALYGLRPLAAGQVVLTEGTGGVSIFALQFAKAAGATVIATTSSPEKATFLKGLGANHVINYNETPEWGAVAAALTPDGAGVDHVVEVGGPKTMAQSLKAVRIDGVISVIGFVAGGGADEVGFLDCLMNVCTVRGLVVGSRAQFEDMNRSIEANKIKPVVDPKAFTLDQTKEAYQYMWDQKHVGKLTIRIE